MILSLNSMFDRKSNVKEKNQIKNFPSDLKFPIKGSNSKFHINWLLIFHKKFTSWIEKKGLHLWTNLRFVYNSIRYLVCLLMLLQNIYCLHSEVFCLWTIPKGNQLSVSLSPYFIIEVTFFIAIPTTCVAKRTSLLK